MVCHPVCTATTRFLVGSSKLLCFRFYKTLCFPTYTTFTLPYNFSHQNVCVFNSLTEVLRSHLKNSAMLTGGEVLCFLIPSQRRGVGESYLFKTYVTFSVYDISRILSSICSVTPFLDQVFRCFFSARTTSGCTARTMLCPPLAWDDPRQSCLHPPKVFQSLLLPKLRWWRPRHPLLRWWRRGRLPSQPRLRPPHPCIRTAQWLLTTSLLLLLLRRSPTRHFWQESPRSYHLSPSVQRSLVLRSLLARWWRRRRLDPDFPLPS